jgi:hypothetical protein
MPRLGFELTLPVFEWAKTFNALDCAATVIGPKKNHSTEVLHSTSYYDYMIRFQIVLQNK